MKLSTIVPTLNEERTLAKALASIPSGAEVIVADGGSTDRTAEVAKQHDARLVVGGPGRAAQMNRGARLARGEVLLFLHADCVLDPSADRAIEQALSDARVVGGSFRLRIRPAGIGLSIVSFGSNLRARFLKLPYGDQALFVRRTVFEEMGGYREIPILEDVDLVTRLRKRGHLERVALNVTTTPRHWERLGTVLTTLLNWSTIVAYRLGISPVRLARAYRRLHRSARPNSTADPLRAR